MTEVNYVVLARAAPGRKARLKLKLVTIESSYGREIKRIRGDLTQQKFANLMGVGKNTVIRYESNERIPDANFLYKLHSIFGADPTRVVLGRDSVHIHDPDEIELLNGFRAARDEVKRTIKRIVEITAIPRLNKNRPTRSTNHDHLAEDVP